MIRNLKKIILEAGHLRVGRGVIKTAYHGDLRMISIRLNTGRWLRTDQTIRSLVTTGLTERKLTIRKRLVCGINLPGKLSKRINNDR